MPAMPTFAQGSRSPATAPSHLSTAAEPAEHARCGDSWRSHVDRALATLDRLERPLELRLEWSVITQSLVAPAVVVETRDRP